MTYIKKELPPYDELHAELTDNIENIRKYLKYESVFGSIESMSYFMEKLKSFEKPTQPPKTC